MKNTIYMLIITVTVLITWLFVSVFIAFFNDISYADGMRHPIHVFFVLFLYWVPPILVCQDYDESRK
jgi:hypothetical protein